MLKFEEIKVAVDWLIENESYKLLQWTVDNFGGMFCYMAHLVETRNVDKFVKELMEYGLDVQIELVELMYN